MTDFEFTGKGVYVAHPLSAVAVDHFGSPEPVNFDGGYAQECCIALLLKGFTVTVNGSAVSLEKAK